MKRMRYVLTSLLAIGALTGCSNITPANAFGNALKVESVELDITYYKAQEAGEQFTITPTVHYKDDKEVKIESKWITSNPNIATVDNGVVTTLAGGHCNISYLAGIKMASCYVEIPKDDTTPPTDPDDPEVPGEFTIKLDKSTLTLKENETYTFTVTMSQASEVTWTSTDPSVATISSSGMVTALKEGTTTIVASAQNKYARCEVTVSNQAPDPGQPEEDMDLKVYFFIDYNNVDEDDTSGKKLLAFFWWYQGRPIAESGKIPANPTSAPDKAFPYFVGWSDHSIIDSKSQLIDLSTYTSDSSFVYIYGIWTDNQGGLIG